MLHEAPPKRLGQIVFNQTVNSGSPLILIPSGANLRGAILRTCIVTPAPSPAPAPSVSGLLIADISFMPFPPPIGVPSTARLLLVTDASGFAQLDWPVYLDPGLGLIFDPGMPSSTSTFVINASWDYGSLPAA